MPEYRAPPLERRTAMLSKLSEWSWIAASIGKPPRRRTLK
jgi:hypothetical protein